MSTGAAGLRIDKKQRPVIAGARGNSVVPVTDLTYYFETLEIDISAVRQASAWRLAYDYLSFLKSVVSSACYLR